MRFAFKTAPQHTTWTDLLAVWQAADELDVFESGWLFDHFYPIGTGDHHGPCLEGWTALAALAQATTRLRLGVLVTGVHYRHPAVLANAAATLDLISGGRLELGLGAGWNEEESGAYGIELGSPADRSDRFEEACEVIVRLLRDEVTDFDGRFYTLQQARCEPKPAQRPHPPLGIGGSGERRTLRTTARFAQHWNFVGGRPQELAAKLEVLHRHCAEVGRDPSEILISSHVGFDPAVGPQATVAEIKALQAVGLELAIVRLLPPHTPDVLPALAAALSSSF
jgi:F420-dependent oxidoreductase-like protein